MPHGSIPTYFLWKFSMKIRGNRYVSLLILHTITCSFSYKNLFGNFSLLYIITCSCSWILSVWKHAIIAINPNKIVLIYHGHAKCNGNFLVLILLNLSEVFCTDDQSPFFQNIQLLLIIPRCPSFSFNMLSHPNQSSELIFLSFFSTSGVVLVPNFLSLLFYFFPPISSLQWLCLVSVS